MKTRNPRLLNTNIIWPLLVGLLVSMKVSTIALAQTEADDGVVELSPFEVRTTAEMGYLTTETNSATRFAADRRDLPFSITSLTIDLLEEMRTVNAIEAMDLSSSATPEENVFSGHDNRPMIRGTSSPRFFVEGMFYNSTQSPGGVAVDSIEILKGTSAMLYGQGEPGGTINYQLKKPEAKHAGRFSVMAGSYDEREVRFEHTGPVDKKGRLTFRVGYSQFDGESTHDRYSSSNTDGFARLRWKYDGENRFLDIYHIYSKSETDAVVQHLLDGYHGITNLQMKTDIFTKFESKGLPDPLELGMIGVNSHNDASEDSFATVRASGTTATWNHEINKTFTLRASYSRTEMPRYLWRNLSDPFQYVETAVSRNYIFTDPVTGLPDIITVQRGDIIKNTGGQLRDDKLSSNSFVVNLLGQFEYKNVVWKTVLGFDYIEESFETESWYSNYHYDQISNGTARLGAFGDRIPIVLGNVFRPEEGLTADSEPFSSYDVHGGYSESRNDGAGYYWTNFLQFFSGRLSLVTSTRYDRSELTVDAVRQARTDGLDPFIPGETNKFDEVTYSIGGNWYLLQNWGVFANYATSFRPEVSTRFGRDRLPITDNRDPFEGEGWDAGIKFTTDDGRFFAMATVFQTKKRNLWGRLQGQELDSDGNPVWEDVDETIPSLISYEAQTGEQLAEGIELELTGQVLSNLQVRFGWTWLHTAEISKDEEPFMIGQRLRSSPEHKISASINYSIRKGWLAFSSVGLNVTALIDDRVYWVDPNNRRLNVGQLGDGSPYVGEADRFWGDGYTRVDFFFRKRFQFDNLGDIWLQLNVYNIFDKDHQRFRSIGTPRTYRVSIDYRW